METEILIFDIPEIEISVNKNKRELEYENLKRNSKLDNYNFEGFYDLQLFNEKMEVPNSNMISILCTYIIKYFGIIISDNIDKQYSINIQVDTYLNAFNKDTGKYQNIPANQTFNIIGLQVPDILQRIPTYTSLSHFDHIDNITLANAGNFGLIDYQTLKYTQMRKNLSKAGNLSNIKNNIMFTDEKSTKKLFDKLIKYIKYAETYYNNNLLLLYLDFKIPPYLPDFDYVKVLWDIKRKATDNVMINDLQNIYTGVIGKNYNYDVLYSITNNNMLYLYNLGILLGIDSNQYKLEYDRIKKKKEYNDIYNRLLEGSYNELLESIKKKNISYEKYGIDNLEILDSNQLAVIDLEYNKMIKIQTINTLRSKNIQKLFNELVESLSYVSNKELSQKIKEIKKEVKEEELKGNKLIEHVACPHIFALGLTTLNNNNKANLYSEINKNVVEKYSLPYDLNGFFCKICGAQLAESNKEGIIKFLGNELIREGMFDDDIQSIIWKETMYIISTYIKFIMPTPIKPFVNSISATLRNIISNEENKLIKNRTHTTSSIKDTLNLYSCIYIYAALCVIMLDNPKRMMFGRDNPNNKLGSSDRNMEERKKERSKRKKKMKHKGGNVNNTNNTKSYEKYLLTTALNLIILTKDSIIKKVKYMNIDLIKQIFLKEAYVWAKKYIKPINIKNTDEKNTSIMIEIINYDPFYKYMYYAKKLSYFNGNNKLKNVGFYDTKNILGRDIDKIEIDMTKKVSIYETIDEIPEWKIKDKIFDYYTWRSFMQEYEYIKQKIYEKSFEPLHSQVVEYIKNFEDINDYEKKIFRNIDKSNIRPSIIFKWLHDIRGDYDDYRSEKIDLARYYCDDGQKHKINKYVYNTKDHKNEEYTIEEIIRWLEDKNLEKIAKFSFMKLINERCERCNKLIRTENIDSSNNKKLETIFKSKDNINAFYTYYKYRCPEGNLHEIIDSKCIKCGLEIKLNVSINKKNYDIINDIYYNKYIQIFKNVESENRNIFIEKLRLAQDEYKIVEVKKKQLEYRFTLINTAEWAKLVGVKYNILINIGLVDEKKFDDIKNSIVDVSKKIDDDYDKILLIQAMRLKNYINSILQQYNMIMNYNGVMYIPEHIKKIILEQNKIGIEDISKGMPQFKDDFSVLDKKYNNLLNPRNYSNFLQEYLAKIIIKINNDSSVKYKKMASNLIKYFTNDIIEQEKLYCKEESLFSISKLDITSIEEANELNIAISGDEYEGYSTEKSEIELGSEENSDYENKDIINNIEEIYDVENVNDIWEE